MMKSSKADAMLLAAVGPIDLVGRRAQATLAAGYSLLELARAGLTLERGEVAASMNPPSWRISSAPTVPISSGVVGAPSGGHLNHVPVPGATRRTDRSGRLR